MLRITNVRHGVPTPPGARRALCAFLHPFARSGNVYIPPGPAPRCCPGNVLQVLYRLAAYADQRYREVVAVLQSPEHVKRMSVVIAKRREADGIRAKRGTAVRHSTARHSTAWVQHGTLKPAIRLRTSCLGIRGLGPASGVDEFRHRADPRAAVRVAVLSAADRLQHCGTPPPTAD